MAFVMIATGATSRSRVRTLSVRPLVAAAGLAALALLGSGGAVGYWVCRVRDTRGDADRRRGRSVQPALPFTLEQVGAISGRLFRLESEAAQLSKRIGVLGKESAARRHAPRPVATRRRRRPRPAPAAARGWRRTPMRPRAARSPLSTPSSAGSSNRSPASPSVAAQRSLEQMRLPTRLPIAGAELTSGFGNRRRPVRPLARVSCRHRLRGADRDDDRLGGRRRRRLCRLQARLRLGGRDRPRQRPGDALRARLRAAGAIGPGGDPGRPRSPSSARPADRPARICTSKCCAPATTSTRSSYLAGL